MEHTLRSSESVELTYLQRPKTFEVAVGMGCNRDLSLLCYGGSVYGACHTAMGGGVVEQELLIMVAEWTQGCQLTLDRRDNELDSEMIGS